MLAFEVSLNGKVLYVAGFSEGHFLQSRVQAHRHPAQDISSVKDATLTTSIPGSADGPLVPIKWGGIQQLSIGDSVTVRVIEVDEGSEPDETDKDALAAKGRFIVGRSLPQRK